MTTSSLVSEPVWCTSKGDGEGGREGKSQRGEKGMDACDKNPLLFISVAAGICNLLIGWTTLSNLLRCIKLKLLLKIIRNNHDADIERTVVYWHKLWKITIYANEVVTSHSNLFHFSLPFLFLHQLRRLSVSIIGTLAI